MLDLSAVDTPDALFIVDNNCGTGAGGFQPGNTCAKGGGGDSLPVGVTQEMYDNWKKIQDSGKTVKDPYYDKILASTKKWVALGEPIGSAFGIQAMVYTDHMMKAQAAETGDQPAGKSLDQLKQDYHDAYVDIIKASDAYSKAGPDDFASAQKNLAEKQAAVDAAHEALMDELGKEGGLHTDTVVKIAQDAHAKFLAGKEEPAGGLLSADPAKAAAALEEAKATQRVAKAKDPNGDPNIPGVGQLHKLKTLGGSTGAQLMLSDDGSRYVMKGGNSEKHILEEHYANQIYEAMGVDVPNGAMRTGKDGNVVRVAEFVEGKTLSELKGSERKAAEDKLRENFASDALLGNWDVVGMNADNVMVSEDGQVYRIDNGGSLRYRAQGAMKTLSQFDNTVGELTTMREKGMAGKVFGSLTDEEVAAQITTLYEKKAAIIAAAPDDLKPVLEGRLEYMRSWADKVSPAAGLPKAGTFTDSTGNTFDLDPGKANYKVALKMAEKQLAEGKTLGGMVKAVYEHHTGQSQATTSSSSKSSNPHAGDNLKQLITSTKGGTFYTDLQIAKIVALNPEGPKDGKFYISAAKSEVMQAHIAHLKTILPEGTDIQVKNINAAKAKELLTKGDAQASAYIKPVKMALAKATSKIDGPGVADAALGTMKAYDTGYASDSLYWKGTPGGGVVEHTTGTFEFKTEVPKGFEYYSEKDTAWQGSLKPTEKKAINSWTGGGYVEMRKRIAAGKPEAKDKHFLAAIGKSPDFQGTLYRGIKSGGSNGYGVKLMQAIAEIGVGGIWGEKCPASSSVSPRTAKGFSGDHILLKIQAKTAKSLFSAGVNSQEKEVILQPNKKYRITGITKNAPVKVSSLGPSTVKMLVELEEL